MWATIEDAKARVPERCPACDAEIYLDGAVLLAATAFIKNDSLTDIDPDSPGNTYGFLVSGWLCTECDEQGNIETPLIIATESASQVRHKMPVRG